MRDVFLADTIYVAFTTRAFATGIPTVLAGTPVVSAYEDAGLTQITAGITLGVSHDSVVGLNMLTIVATGANGFEDNKDYNLVITTGTVGGVSVVGEVVGQFSIQRAPVNWANVSNPTTALDLSGTDIQLADTTTDVTNQVTANMTAVSGDTTAADNIEATYDGTGYADDQAPATQAQLSSIANVGSAIHKPAISYTLTTGTQSANTVSSTEALDGTRHEHTDTAGVMELYYEFAIGAGVPSSCQVTGYVTGGNDNLDVYGYDWVAAGWVQIGNIQGAGSTSNSVYSFDMFVDMVGTGANAGTVRVRLYKASGLTTALLAVDQIFVAFSQDAVSALDAVYFDSNASNTGTTSIDGVPGNPVSTEAAVNTLLAARNLYKVVVALESSVTFATSHTNEIWEGAHWICAQGGQDLSGSHLVGADTSGIATSSSDPVDYVQCNIGTGTYPQFHMRDCDFDGTVTFGEVGSYLISGSHSGIAGATTPIFDTGAALANVNFIVADWHNGFELRNLNNLGTDLFSISGTGQIIYAASSSGTVNQRGDWKVTNTGGVTITEDDNTSSITIIEADTADMQPKLGTITDLGSGATVGNNLVDIESQTDDIGVAGAGLTDLGGMSTGMKAEVNAEADTALADYDGPTNAEMEARTPTAAQLAYIVENAATGVPVTFTTSGGSTTAAVLNQVDGAAASATDDQYNGRLLVFNLGTLNMAVTDITDYVGGTTTATITAIPFAPTSSHTARLI